MKENSTMSEINTHWKEEEEEDLPFSMDCKGLSQVNDFPFAFVNQSSVEADDAVAMKLVFLSHT